MSLYSTNGARPVALTPLPANALGGKGIGAQITPPSGNVAARLPTVDPVPLQNDIVNLSSKALQSRVIGLASSTSEAAQHFMTAIAQRLFGDQADTAQVSYNMTAFTASASYASSSSDTSSAEGTTHNDTFNLSESASFTGTGQISTDDGRVFDFELSVKYEARVEATSTEQTSKPEIVSPDVLVLTGKPLPAIKFPGSLDDLFKLLSRELRTDVSGTQGPNSDPVGGNLTLRLMRLVDRAALLAPRVRPDDPNITPAEQAKAVANSYGSAPAIDNLSAA
ncbi:MAG: hypothetical protein V4484_00080 [Pseudomonadota bacterium]